MSCEEYDPRAVVDLGLHREVVARLSAMIGNLTANMNCFSRERDGAMRVADMHQKIVDERNAQIREYQATEEAIKALLKEGTDDADCTDEGAMPVGARVNIELAAEYNRGRREMYDGLMEVVRFSLSEARAYDKGERVHAYDLLLRRLRQEAEELGVLEVTL